MTQTQDPRLWSQRSWAIDWPQKSQRSWAIDWPQKSHISNTKEAYIAPNCYLLVASDTQTRDPTIDTQTQTHTDRQHST